MPTRIHLWIGDAAQGDTPLTGTLCGRGGHFDHPPGWIITVSIQPELVDCPACSEWMHA